MLLLRQAARELVEEVLGDDEGDDGDDEEGGSMDNLLQSDG